MIGGQGQRDGLDGLCQVCAGTTIKRRDLMEKANLSIPNISCGHCVMTIKRELAEMKGVIRVEGDPDSKQINVEWEDPASLEKIKSTLEEIHYPAA
jgi:copper chaperone CopZ